MFALVPLLQEKQLSKSCLSWQLQLPVSRAKIRKVREGPLRENRPNQPAWCALREAPVIDDGSLLPSGSCQCSGMRWAQKEQEETASSADILSCGSREEWGTLGVPKGTVVG